MGFDADNPETIISAVCIPNLCCQNSGGCNYVDSLAAANVEGQSPLCALYRNSSTRLCSECIEGYSESINSEQCVQCEESFNWPFLFLPLIMAVGMSLIILITNFTEISRKHPPPPPQDDVPPASPSVDDDDDDLQSVPSLKSETTTLRAHALAEIASDEKKLMFASLAKIIIYYEQVRCPLLCKG